MLVLTRRAGERIFIGKEVVITVVRIGPNSVRLGIFAPKEMNIVREELASGGGVAHYWLTTGSSSDNLIEIELPIDGVTVPGGSHPIQVGEDDVAEIGRR